jgi:uncharacterized membrane protein
LSQLTDLVYVYLLSLIPSFEGRYALLAGIAMGLSPELSLLVATLGVITLSLILPLALPLLDDLMASLAGSGHTSLRSAAAIYLKYVKRVRERSKRYIRRYGLLGLIIFVAIPFPGTGVWTGSLAAYLFGMDRKSSAISLMIGGLISNAIMFVPAFTAIHLRT